MIRTVVTGGAGFIGSHLTEHLLSLGNSVIVIDDFSTGRKSNLRAVEDDPNLTVVVGSVADHDVVCPAIEGAEEVYHLAVTVGVQKVLDDPLRGFANNLSGNGERSVGLDALRRRGPHRLFE